MRLVVTGACGQLAQSLGERSPRDGDFELVFLGRPQIDLEIAGSAADAIKKATPDVVIHTAAYTAVDAAEAEPERAFLINADASGEVAAAATEVGAAVVYISTDYVFDGSKSQPYEEEDTVNPLGVYGRSKLAGEEQVRASNPRHAIVRTAWIYGPFGQNFVKSIIGAAATRENLTVVDDQRGNPTCSLDLADALLAMLEVDAGWGETYHLAGRGSATWCELAREIMTHCAHLGIPNVPVQAIRSEDWPTRAVRPRNSQLDSSKFEGTFGFLMPDWRLSVRTVVERLAKMNSCERAR